MDPWKYFTSFASNKGMTPFMILLLLLSSVMGGRTGSMRDIEPQRHHNIPSNISAIKTIQSEDGDIIDCIDIHKQPSLNHPLLKNHSIQMRPSFYQIEVENNLSSKPRLVKQIWKKSGGCPVGTIPIQRNRQEGLSKDFPSPMYEGEVFSGAIVEKTIAYSTQGAPYYGAKSAFNVWSVQVEPHEFSVSLVDVSNVAQSNLVLVGWGVWPDLLGDSQTRWFIYWTADGSNSTGCYNLLCSGFVQVSNNVALGSTISPLSSYGGTQRTFEASITKDDAQSSWWLEAFGELVGYWPLSLFNDLQDATLIIWGGGVYNSNINGHHTSTQLGSGHFANEGYGKAAFIDGMQVMDSSRVFVTPSEIDYSIPKPNCYSIYHPGPSSDPGASFYYGGPGGSGCG